MTPIEFVRDPETFMAERVEATPLVPAVALGIAGLAGAAVSVIVTQQTLGAIGGGGETFRRVMLAVTVATSLVVPFVVWGVIAGTVHLLTMAFAAEGSFRRTLRVTGYALLPYALGTFVVAGVQYYVLGALPPVQEPEQVQAFARAYENHSLVTVSSITYTAFLVWSGVLLTLGIEHARHVTRREAAIAAGIPIGLWALWQLVGVAGALPVG